MKHFGFGYHHPSLGRRGGWGQAGVCAYSQCFLGSRNEVWLPVLLADAGDSVKIPLCVFLVKFLIYSILAAFTCHLEIDARGEVPVCLYYQ